MDIEEYKRKLKAISDKDEKEKTDLIVECAMSNNTIKKGDLITGNQGSIIVDKIKVSMISGYPKCVYFGQALTKKLVPFKKHTEIRIHQSAIIAESKNE